MILRVNPTCQVGVGQALPGPGGTRGAVGSDVVSPSSPWAGTDEEDINWWVLQIHASVVPRVPLRHCIFKAQIAH